MEKALADSIDELGGKHGVLSRLLDTELAGHVVPLELLSLKESLIDTQRQALIRNHDKLDGHGYVVRSSHPADWGGLVDVMKTTVVETIEEVDAALTAVREHTESPMLPILAKMEDVDLQPEDCTFSVAPYLGEEMRTVTEHPNTPQRSIMIDQNAGGQEYLDGRDDELMRLSREKQVFSERPEIFCRDLHVRLQALGIFPEDVALQDEIGIHQDRLWIYQVRDFAQKNPLPGYEEGSGQQKLQRRYFGPVPTEPLPVAVAPGSFNFDLDLGGVPHTYMRDSETEPYIAINPLWQYAQEAATGMFFYRAKAYVAKRNSLMHCNAKHIQAVLRRRGSAVLAATAPQLAEGLAPLDEIAADDGSEARFRLIRSGDKQPFLEKVG